MLESTIMSQFHWHSTSSTSRLSLACKYTQHATKILNLKSRVRITPILLARLFLDLREAVDGRPIDGSETITDINHFSRFSAPDIDQSIELNSRDKQADPNGPIRFRSTRERTDSWSLSDVDPQEAASGQGQHG